MKPIIIFSLLLSYLLSMSSYPMFLIVIISAQTLIICLTLMILSPTSWYSFILFLVFMGGLMVLFIYISSLASNEKFNFMDYLNPIKLIPLISLIMVIPTIMLNSQIIKTFMVDPSHFIYKIYAPSTVILIFMTMLYLLLALVIIVNITSMQEGAMRQLK